MNSAFYTRQIEAVIGPEPSTGELAVFNPTAATDSQGVLQVLYRAANPQRVTRLARSAWDGSRFVRQAPLSARINTGDSQSDRLLAAALANSEEDPRLVRLPGDPNWHATIVGLRYPPYTPAQMALTVLARMAKDFSGFEVFRLLTPADIDDRHVIPFPERIGGQYALLSRPQLPGPLSYVDAYSGLPSSVYLALTPDLAVRVNDMVLLSPVQPWEARRIGGVGPQPCLTSQGWLVIYMAIDLSNRYSVGAALLERETLTLRARTSLPILSPDDDFNRRFPVTGFGMENVIFATTALVDEGRDEVAILAGCNDVRVGKVVIPFKEMVAAMD